MTTKFTPVTTGARLSDQVAQQLAIAGELADQVRTVLTQDLPALEELEAA